MESDKSELNKLKKKIFCLQKELEEEKKFNEALIIENGTLKEKEIEYIKKINEYEINQKRIIEEINQIKEQLKKERNENKDLDIKIEELENQIQNSPNYLFNVKNNNSIFQDDDSTKDTNYVLKVIENKRNNIKKEEPNLIANNKKVIKNIIIKYDYPPLIGLNNIGGAYYINAILQCLSQTKKLTLYFLNIQKKDRIINNNIAKINKNAPQLSPKYLELIQQLWNKNGIKNYSPINFINIIEKMEPKFKQSNSDNIKDFICFILEQLNEELKRPHESICQKINLPNQQEKSALISFFESFGSETSIITNLFYGIIENNEKCVSSNIKNNTYYQFKGFNHLVFPLEEFREMMGNTNYKNNISIDDCFYYFISRKIYTKKNDNQCKICESKCITQFTSKIFDSPYILILILDRGKENKFKIKIDFNEYLDIGKYVLQKGRTQSYQLYGVITQIRQNEKNLVASCRNPIDHNWYRYNDSDVYPIYDIKKEIFEFGIPLVLFYSKLTT